MYHTKVYDGVPEGENQLHWAFTVAVVTPLGPSLL